MIVNLTYFKPNGKFYSEGMLEVESNPGSELYLFDIWEKVRSLRDRHELPGLIPGSRPSETKEWIVSVDVPDHEHNHPHLII